MANYRMQDARWTMILVRRPQHGGDDLWEVAPFELVRFNVDSDPDAPQQVVPIGQSNTAVTVGGTKQDSPKIYEKIWFVDTVPWRPGANGKHYFGNVI